MKDTDTNAGNTSSYILNREYFSECFDESASNASNLKTYLKAILLIIVAGILFTIKIEAYVAWFLLCMGGVELLSIRYKRSWWVTRQMLSRASGNKVNIRINDQGIFTDSPHHQQGILWRDITDISRTEKGFVVTHNNGTNYLSRRGLHDDALALLCNSDVQSRTCN